MIIKVTVQIKEAAYQHTVRRIKIETRSDYYGK